MKKKLMMVAAIIGVLSLGACVDDSESASTTAVRNAKAKQLEAMAALSNAQAEAALISANAQKAMIDADIAYKQAETEALKAETQDQQRLIEEAKQKFAFELEIIKAQAEREILAAKKEADTYEKELLAQAETKITQLASNYTTALNKLNGDQGLRKKLLDERFKLVGLQANLVSAELYVADEKARINQEITLAEAAIAYLKGLDPNDKENMEKELEDLDKEMLILNDTKASAKYASDKADEAYTSASNNLNYYWNSTSTSELIKTAYQLQREFGFDNFLISYMELAKNDQYTYGITVIDGLRESALIAQRGYMSDEVKRQKNDIGAPAAGTTDATGLYLDLKYWQDILASQQAEGSGATEQDIRYTQQNIADVNQIITDAKVRLAEYEASVTEFERLVTLISSQAVKDAYTADLDALKKLAETKLAANQALTDAKAAYKLAETSVENIEGLLYGHYDNITGEWISGLNDFATQIAGIEDEILNYKAELAGLTNVQTAEDAITVAEGNIASFEAQITVQETLIARIKAALDAAIKAGE